MNGAKILCRTKTFCCQNRGNIFLYHRVYLHTHYDTLGIKKTATQEEIKLAFVQLSKKFHPDVNRDDPKTHEKFVKLNAAYTVLSKPASRREYDMKIHGTNTQSSRYGSHPYYSYEPGFRPHKSRQSGQWYYENRYGFQDSMKGSGYQRQHDPYGDFKRQKQRNAFIRIHSHGFMFITFLIAVFTYTNSIVRIKKAREHRGIQNQAMVESLHGAKHIHDSGRLPEKNTEFRYSQWRKAVNTTDESR